MKIFISVLILILGVISCTNEENLDIPRIDQSLIKADDLIWNLDLLQQMPDFEYLDSTSKVREILFHGPLDNGKKTKVFAYYSNPDILKTGSNQGNCSQARPLNYIIWKKISARSLTLQQNILKLLSN